MGKRKLQSLGEDAAKQRDKDESSSSYSFSDDFEQEDERSDDGSSSDEGEEFDCIDVDFDFFDPSENDYHGIRTLMANFLDGQEYECSRLVDGIMSSQGSTVIKCGEDGNVIGLGAVIPDIFPKDFGILNFVSANCPDELKAELKQTWMNPKTALLISERLLNTPPQLGPPLMETVFGEIDEFDKIETCLLLGRAYTDCKRSPIGVDGLIFALPEYEFLGKHARWSFSFDVKNRPSGKDDLKALRFVACIPASKLQDAFKEMSKIIPVA